MTLRRYPKVKALLLITALAFVLLTCASGLAAGGADETKALKELGRKSRVEHDNPHTALGCEPCHGVKDVRADSAGRIPFAAGSLTETCYSCHDRSTNIHPVGQKPSMKVPDHLPLEDGRVTCATCHDMHAARTRDHLLRGFAEGRYKNRPDLCIDCHGETFVKKNPHINQKERGLCVFCHQAEPTQMDTEKTVRFRFGILRTCTFCHNVAERNHPMNVDKDIKPPMSLPRDVDGSVTCATCHNPHGSTDTLHFLRREYIVTLETARNFNPHINDCLACHTKPPRKGQPVEIRYGGDIELLCNSCHGAHNVHPVNIKPGKDMHPPASLPLDKDGRIICITCHAVDWSNGRVTLRMFNETEGSMRALCYSCHDESKFSKTNPHKDISQDEGCLFCHERMPDRKTDTAATVSFITSLRMICLRCHDRFPHPADKEHLVLPTMDVPKDLPLDEAGRITCITCHNPHLGGEKGSAEDLDRRLRRPGDKLCDACHVSKY